MTTHDLSIVIAGIQPEAPIEFVMSAVNDFEAFMQRARDLEKQFKTALTEYIQVNGDVTVGTIRYYVGNPKKVKCRDNLDTLNTCLEIAGPRATGALLASDAWKYAAVESALSESGNPDLYPMLFEVTYPAKLLEGKPVKTLQKTDLAFVRGAA